MTEAMTNCKQVSAHTTDTKQLSMALLGCAREINCLNMAVTVVFYYYGPRSVYDNYGGAQRKLLAICSIK